MMSISGKSDQALPRPVNLPEPQVDEGLVEIDYGHRNERLIDQGAKKLSTRRVPLETGTDQIPSVGETEPDRSALPS